MGYVSAESLNKLEAFVEAQDGAYDFDNACRKLMYLSHAVYLIEDKKVRDACHRFLACVTDALVKIENERREYKGEVKEYVALFDEE